MLLLSHLWVMTTYKNNNCDGCQFNGILSVKQCISLVTKPVIRMLKMNAMVNCILDLVKSFVTLQKWKNYVIAYILPMFATEQTLMNFILFFNSMM